MKFIKKININKYKLYIDIQSRYIINKHGLVFLGNPIFDDLDTISSENKKKKFIAYQDILSAC